MSTQANPGSVVNHPALEVETSDDSGISDLDSIYSTDDTGSVTDTLKSYVERYTYLQGRRFDHKQQHIASNDAEQQEQLDLFHDIYFRVLGKKHFLAPIEKRPQRVLDCGTGTGIWAVDFADAHPSAVVVGNDISPIQPRWVPPNCSFEVDDFNEKWTHTKNSFDFVHCRALHGSVTDWGVFCEQAFRVLKPGGWIEVVDEDVALHCDDDTLPETTPIRTWLEDCIKLLNGMGRDPVPYRGLRKHMESAGFDMSSWKQEAFHIPIGTWPKKKEDKVIGAMMLANMLQGIEGWSLLLFTKVMGISEEEFTKRLKEWTNDLRQKKQHKYMDVHVTYVQKPLDPKAGESEHTVS